MAVLSNNKTTFLVSSQLPQFVRDDHETFVTFLEEYYKFLAQDGQIEYVSKNFNNFLDIDIIKEHIELTEEDVSGSNDYHAFLQKLYDNFIALLPAKMVADKAIVLKHAKDFYRATGSEKSVRFLLRILLNKEINEDVGFYYPKRDVLRASDGKWYVEKSIRITDIAVNNTSNTIATSNFVNKIIRGITSNATAIVESTDQYYQSGALITELKLSNTFKNFLSGEKIFCFYTEEGLDRYLTANIFSGIVTSVSLSNGGSGYIEGAFVPVEGGGGTGAQVIIKTTTKGTLSSIGVITGGAGFRSNDSLLFSGGGGSGAAGNVLTVNIDETYHPNSYNIIASIISLESNTLIGNAVYSNLSPSVFDPANSWISNSMSAWSFSNCGPIFSCFLINTGNNYSTVPSITAQGNTTIKTLGILGRLEVINGGLNYQVGDKLEFVNPIGAYGSGGSANVTAVAGNGAITQVKFEAQTGEIPGGAGYEIFSLPYVNVSSATGNGANIIVKTLLGHGETLTGSTTEIGKIVTLTLVSGGSGYTSAPTINLANMTSGSGGIATSAIATGIYTYPGRYLNDDGQLSGYNFLEDRDYYQNYSYVIRVDAPVIDYKKVVTELTHPAGTRLFGQYLIPKSNDIIVEANTESSITNTSYYLSSYKIHTSDVLKTGTYNVKTLAATYNYNIIPVSYAISSNTNAVYDSRLSTIVVNSANNKFVAGDNVYLQFSNSSANIVNGLYTVTYSNTNYFVVSVRNGNTTLISLPANTSNLTASSGYGNTNAYITLSHHTANSNVKINIGDSLNVDGNIVSVLYTNAYSNLVIVYPELTGNLLSNTVFVLTAPYNAYGNVKIFDTTINLLVGYPQSEIHTGDNVYVKFSSSDTTLANDRYYIVRANSNVIKMRHSDITNASSLVGNANIHLKTITVTSNNHSLSNLENVFMTFTTGDSANVTNGVYTIYNRTANTFNIVSANSITTGGDAFIKTANVIASITSHGFDSNDSVYMWFTSGDTANLDNGYYTVSVIDSNRLSIIPDEIPSSNGNLTVYRNNMNVTINRVNHGFSSGNNVLVMFDTGDLTNVSNGIYLVNSVANNNTYNIIHNAITIKGNISNLISVTTGNVYVSASI